MNRAKFIEILRENICGDEHDSYERKKKIIDAYDLIWISRLYDIEEIKILEDRIKKLENAFDKAIYIIMGGGTLGDTCLKKCPFRKETTEELELFCLEECKSKDRWKEWCMKDD